MNYKNYFLILFVSLSVLSCKSDDDNAEEPSFLLTETNLAGNYNHTYFMSTKTVNGTFQGLPVTVTTTVTADTYDGELTIDANGTFDTSGAFRKITNKTDGTTTTNNEDIIILNDDGTFSLDANTSTIIFTGFNVPADPDDPNSFDNGIYSFSVFNENEIRLVQEYTVEVNDETTDYLVEIRFTR